MKSILIYTFRTFTYIKDLYTMADEVFVLGKLKEDFLKLEKLIAQGKYDYTVGIGKGNNRSMFETKGVNKFNKGNIIKEGKELYQLAYPIEGYFPIGVNNSYTTSFCNWGIYNAKVIEDNNLQVEHSFIHISEKDIQILKEYLASKRVFFLKRG